MALDGAFLYAVKGELDFLVGARIDKIHQPSKEEIIIAFRTNGGNYRLLISSAANAARVHITKSTVENPKSPPMFCMLLRKHLGGGKLLAIRQDGLERILYLDFETMNEIGDMVCITIACEIMGRCSNLIIINAENKVIDSIKRVDEEMSRERLVLPGMKYTLPPRDNRLSILTAGKDEIKQAIFSAKNDELSKCLIRAFEGISPIFARECAFYATKGRDTFKDEISEDSMDRLLFYIVNTRESLLNRKNTYNVVLDKENNLKDFSFVGIHQYGNLMITRQFSSACETLDYFYSERDAVNRMKQRSHDLLKYLVNTTDRITRKIAAQKEELIICAERDSLKIKGDLISANIYKLTKGDSIVSLENFYSENGELVEIAMNPRLTPSQNAQHYYSEYRRALTAEKKLTELIENGKEELRYLDSIFDVLTRSNSEDEVLELRLELAEQGYIKSNRLKSKPPKQQKPFEYLSSDGFVILVGKNNKQNDKLTLKIAGKADLWLHTHDISGSHTVILTEGRIPTKETIEEAAILAAYHSKGRNSSQVPVDYTYIRFVKKPAGAKPGMVIFTNNKTVYVTPDSELAEKLKA